MAEAGHVEGRAADASANRSRARRLIHIVLAVLVAFVAPVLLLDAVVGQYGADAMVLGVLVGALGSKIGGTRRMLYLAPAIGLAAGLGDRLRLVVGGSACCGERRRGSWDRVRMDAPLLMIPFVATFASQCRRDNMRCLWGSEPLLSSRASGSAPLPRPWWRSCSGRSWVAQRRSAWHWRGPSPTGSQNRSCSSSCTF
jgi:hypothetical protein